MAKFIWSVSDGHVTVGILQSLFGIVYHMNDTQYTDVYNGSVINVWSICCKMKIDMQVAADNTCYLLSQSDKEIGDRLHFPMVV